MDRISNWKAYPWNSISSPAAPNSNTIAMKKMLAHVMLHAGCGFESATPATTGATTIANTAAAANPAPIRNSRPEVPFQARPRSDSRPRS